MFPGQRRASNGEAGLTLIEILSSVLLMIVVFMGVSALYVASQAFYLKANDKVLISYEFQYAVDHIYKNVMRAVGDETSAPSSRPLEVPNPSTLYVTINPRDPITRSNYYNSTITYTYYKSGGELLFDNGSGSPESIASKITVEDVIFALDRNILTIELKGSYRNQQTFLTFYSACYPRLSSFR